MTSSSIDHTQAVEILKRNRAEQDRPKTQSEIVRQHSDLIEVLIRDHNATLGEVGEVISGLGEPVRQPGLEAAIRKLLGHAKDIRDRKTVRLGTDADVGANPIVASGANPFEDDDDNAFVARRPRGDIRQ